MMGALGASSGALLGGVLTQTLGWPAIFAINAPLGLLTIVLGLRFIPARTRRPGPRHFDLPGAVLVTGGLVALTYGIVRTDVLAGRRPASWATIAAGLALLATFVFVEGRVAREIRSCRSRSSASRSLRAANLVVVLLYGALFAMFFLRDALPAAGHGTYGPIEAGLKFLPLTGAVFTGSRVHRSSSPASASAAPRPAGGRRRRRAWSCSPASRRAARMPPSCCRAGSSRASGWASRWSPRRSRRCRACPPPSAAWPRGS